MQQAGLPNEHLVYFLPTSTCSKVAKGKNHPSLENVDGHNGRKV